MAAPTLPLTTTVPTAVPDLAGLVAESGLRRVHVLAWRDFGDPEAGGSELHAAVVARLWAEAGLDVTIRTSEAHGHPEDFVRDGCRVIRRGGRYTVFPRGIAGELSRRHGPVDGLLEVWNGVPWLSPLWARVPRAVMIHHVHQHMWDVVLGPALGAVGKAVELKLSPPAYRRASIVTPSPSTQREVVDLLGMAPERVSVASPGIDPRFTPDPARRAPVPTVVAVGRLTRMKRFDDVIRVASLVRRSVPDLQLVVAGEGPEAVTLHRVVAELQADDWITIAGRVSDDELVDLYRRAWVVTSASMTEGWGMTLTEAAACGTPAVATRITGHCDSVVDGVTGLLAGDNRDLAAKLTAVLVDGVCRRALADAALARAERFTWERCAYGTFLPLAEAAIRRAAARSGRR